jgi:hypothetical protein
LRDSSMGIIHGLDKRAVTIHRWAAKHLCWNYLSYAFALTKYSGKPCT